MSQSTVARSFSGGVCSGLDEPNTATCCTPKAAATCIRPESLLTTCLAALMATVRTAPDPIRPEVTRLVARLHARWTTPAALRAFAAELGDATGDLVAAQLLLGTSQRGSGLAKVLQALARSVAEDVRGRRAVEADRAKPRATARWVTLITIGVLVVLALPGDYVTPYTTRPSL